MASRRYVHPTQGEDLATIAARELPDVEGAEQQLLSWNLHLATRRGMILPSDLVFVEPPPATS